MFLWRNVDTSLSSVDDITPYDIFRFLDATRGGDTENFWDLLFLIGNLLDSLDTCCYGNFFGSVGRRNLQAFKRKRFHTLYNFMDFLMIESQDLF